jgi:HAD superfamily hydrolase (TIGR01490 family)
MDLALFDLDNTLLNGDSDHGWGMFLAELGAVDPKTQQAKQDEFYKDYKNGVLDMQAFLAFQLQPLTQHPIEQLNAWRNQYIDQIIEPMIEAGKPELLEPHRHAGDEILIVTATNEFITRPIADRLGVKHLIATQVETKNGVFTGRGTGVPCFREGKVQRLKAWLDEHAVRYESSYFYSDSINDLPLLEWVDHPVAVTPDDELRAHAQRFHWKIID